MKCETHLYTSLQSLLKRLRTVSDKLLVMYSRNIIFLDFPSQHPCTTNFHLKREFGHLTKNFILETTAPHLKIEFCGSILFRASLILLL